MSIRFVFLIFTCFATGSSSGKDTLLTEDKVCTMQVENKDAEKKFKKNDKLMTDFAFDPEIKASSEKMLSMLIRVKSPMLMNWIKARGLNPEKSPESVAWEWDMYFAKNFILNKYPNNSKVENLKIEKLFLNFLNASFDQKTQQEFEAVFVESKQDALKTIGALPILQDEKEKISKKINSVKIYWPTSLDNSKYAKAPLEFIDWSVAYDPQNNEINVGVNALRHDHQSLRSVFLHELAHSFDSCRWSQDYKINWPFEKIGICLRTWAKVRDSSKLDWFYENKKLSEMDYQKLKNNPTCNNSIYPPIGLQADQLPETFADWFSAEATQVDMIDKNFRSDLCAEQSLNQGSSYLSNRDRLMKIYMANKNIGKKIYGKIGEQICHF